MNRSTTRTWHLAFGLAAIALLAVEPALAHHPMGGKTPSTLMEGLLSGVGHPIIGIDHLAFIIAVGLAAALASAPLLIPAAFIAGTLGGAVLHLASITLPASELVISASVLLLGLVVMLARSMPVGVLAGLVAAAGLFHGFAYAEAIFGAETTPLAAYLTGFAAIQFAIAAGVALFASSLAKPASEFAMTPRFAGAMVAGVGVALVAEKVTALLFPGVS